MCVYMHMCHDTSVGVRQLTGIGCVLLPRGSQLMSSSCRAWWQAHLTCLTEPESDNGLPGSLACSLTWALL